MPTWKKVVFEGDAPEFTTVKLTNLTSNYVPLKDPNTGYLVNSDIFTDGMEYYFWDSFEAWTGTIFIKRQIGNLGGELWLQGPTGYTDWSWNNVEGNLRLWTAGDILHLEFFPNFVTELYGHLRLKAVEDEVTRPELRLEYYGCSTYRRLTTQDSLGGLLITANASWGGAYFNRDDTSKPAMAFSMREHSQTFYFVAAPAGSNPISWNIIATLDYTNFHVRSTYLLVKPNIGEPIVRLTSYASGYGTLDIRYKYNEDGASKHRIGFSDSSGNWMMYAEYAGPVVVTASVRPTLAIKYASDTTLSRIFKSASSSRLDISVNAYYDGSDWQRDSTSSNSTLYVQAGGIHYFYRGVAGSNPISWTELCRFGSTGIIPYQGIQGSLFNYRLSYSKASTCAWFTSSPVYATVTSLSVALSEFRACPFVVGKTETYNAIGIYVVNPVSGGQARLGIYADDGGCYPGSLVVDAGTVDCSTSGAKTLSISQSLSPGLYWLVFLANAVQGLTFNVALTGAIVLVGASGPGEVGRICWSTTYSWGSLPSTFPSGASTTADGAAVWIRKA